MSNQEPQPPARFMSWQEWAWKNEGVDVTQVRENAPEPRFTFKSDCDSEIEIYVDGYPRFRLYAIDVAHDGMAEKLGEYIITSLIEDDKDGTILTESDLDKARQEYVEEQMENNAPVEEAPVGTTRTHTEHRLNGDRIVSNTRWNGHAWETVE